MSDWIIFEPFGVEEEKKESYNIPVIIIIPVMIRLFRSVGTALPHRTPLLYRFCKPGHKKSAEGSMQHSVLFLLAYINHNEKRAFFIEK